MLTTILLTLFLGITLGLILAILSLQLIKINCPKCKKLRPVREVILFSWKTREITGRPCQRCQRPKPQIDITF